MSPIGPGVVDGLETESALATDVRSPGSRRLPRRVADRLGVGPDEETAIGLWLVSRLGVGMMVWIAVWVGAGPKTRQRGSLAMVWQRWDVLRYIDIAQNGYSLRAIHGASVAFFPGFPGALFVVHLLARSWVVSGLLLSFAGGMVACAALARIIAIEAESASPGNEISDSAIPDSAIPDSASSSSAALRSAAVRNGLTLWLCAPAAVFLALGYTESLFLAFALPAWLAARRGHWLATGLLLAAATAIRINGVFVFVAVVVLFLQSRPRGREWLRGSALLIALVPLAGFFTYLHHISGSWTTWHHAEEVGWDRTLNDPLRTFNNTLRYAFGGVLPAHQAWEYQVEILAMAVGFALLIWLLVRRRWAEAVYVAFSVGSLAASHVYLSVPREMLLWWPLWAALGVWTVRRPWVKTVLLTVSTPIMFAIAYLFFTGLWAG